jgi:4-amino-4-deoxy-L-arabinose transferase-like glycosyltransferase
MVVVPLAATGTASDNSKTVKYTTDNRYWVRVAAAGALATSGVLLMAGKRRAGLATAAAGTTLVILDQQETVRAWWHRLPTHLEEVHKMITRVQGAIEELSVQGEKLRNILSR